MMIIFSQLRVKGCRMPECCLVTAWATMLGRFLCEMHLPQRARVH